MNAYYSANDYYKKTFGEKVYKLALEGGYTCPNRDGSKGTGGCIFCSEGGSGDFAEKREGEFARQLEKAKKRVEAKTSGGKFIAYFQSFTCTYMPAEDFEKLIAPALDEPSGVAVSLATRPDCLPDDVMAVIKNAAKTKPVFAELGLQTANEKTAEFINRGYKNFVYEESAKKLKEAGVNVITHLIMGLPGENKEDMLKSVAYACKFSDGVKLQLLHVLKNTRLEKLYLSGQYNPLGLEEYADIICDVINILPPETVVHRITGDPPKRILTAPLWCADKKKVLNFLNAEFKRRGVIQGSKI